MFKEFNDEKKRGTVNHNIDTTNFEYVSLEECVGRTIIPWGFFFTEGQYGKQVVLVTRKRFINMPKRCVPDFEMFEKSEEYVKAIINGEMAITNICMVPSRKYKKDIVIFDYDDAVNVVKARQDKNAMAAAMATGGFVNLTGDDEGLPFN